MLRAFSLARRLSLSNLAGPTIRGFAAVAIFSEDEVPEDMQEFIQLNVELAEIWPNITEKKESLPDAEEWDGVKGKIKDLER